MLISLVLGVRFDVQLPWVQTVEPVVEMKVLTLGLPGHRGSMKDWAQLPGGYPLSSAFPAWTLGLCLPVSPYHSLSQGKLPLALENSLASSLLRPTSNTRGQGSCLRTMLFSVFPMASYGCCLTQTLEVHWGPSHQARVAVAVPSPTPGRYQPGVTPRNEHRCLGGREWFRGIRGPEQRSRDASGLQHGGLPACNDGQPALFLLRLQRWVGGSPGGWAAQPWARAQLNVCIRLDNLLEFLLLGEG